MVWIQKTGIKMMSRKTALTSPSEESALNKPVTFLHLSVYL